MGNNDSYNPSSIERAVFFGAHSFSCQTVPSINRSFSLLPLFSTSLFLSSKSMSAWLLFLLVVSWNLSSTCSFCPPYCFCDDVELAVDCYSSNNLQVVPIFLNPQIKFLSLSNSQIKDITMSLQFYSELQVLDISHNMLESLGNANFEYLKNLQLLNVSCNSVKTLENDVFKGLTSVSVLDLSRNLLERIDRQVFTNLSQIKEVLLDRNRLEFLDWDLFLGLKSLERISVTFNFIQQIEPSSSFLRSNSNYVAFSNNITHNPSDSLFSSFGSSTADWMLDNVRYLDMSSNQLTRLKNNGLAIFAALKELNLCCNYIHTLEDEAFFISSSSNGQLERVNLSHNRLGRVPTEALAKLGLSLRQLDLSSNRISDQISKNAFHGLVQLEILNLSNNPEVLYIDPDALSENVKLKKFEADYLSNITDVSPTLLKNKLFLEHFSLKYASISILSSDFFQPPVSNVAGCLDLTGNPLHCNCSTYLFYRFVSEEKVISMYEMPALFDEGKKTNHEIALNSTSGHDPIAGKFNVPPTADILSHVTHRQLQEANHRTSYPFYASRLYGYDDSENKNGNSVKRHLFYARCQFPSNLAGLLVKDLRPLNFKYCFFDDDQFEIMVVYIASGMLSLALLIITIKLIYIFALSGRLSTVCQTHCSKENCCKLTSVSLKEKNSSDKSFVEVLPIVKGKCKTTEVPLSNLSSNSTSGRPTPTVHSTSQFPFCNDGSLIPMTESGYAVAEHHKSLSENYDDCYQKVTENDFSHQRRNPFHKQSEAPSPLIPMSQQISNPVQTISKKHRSKRQLLQMQGSYCNHQTYLPSIDYSPKHYSDPDTYDSSVKNLQQQHMHSPFQLGHYENPDFPISSMERAKQVPSVLV